MTWSKYLTAIRQSFQRSSRNGAKIQSAILHHGATTNDELIIQMMVSGSRELSSQAVVKNNRRTGVVDEDYRAWTSASPYWDGRSCTIECANESVDGWTISDESYHSMAILLADWSTRYNFPLIRNGRNSTVFGHRELYQYFGDSYATACPGGMDVDRVVREANAIKASKSIKEIKVKHYQRSDPNAMKKGRTLKPGAAISLAQQDVPTSATNIVGGVGNYSIAAHVYAEGKPGDVLVANLVWQKKGGKPSPHYEERLVFDRDGKIQATVTYLRGVEKGYEVFLRVASDSTNTADIKVTRLDTDAFLYAVA